MPLIRRDSIEQVRAKVSLVDIASAYTSMRRSGSQFRGLSPFSEEKTPSFFVHPVKNLFMDYSSGNSGDLFKFVQLKENLSFHEAVEFLARKFGVDLLYEEGHHHCKEERSLRARLMDVHEVATTYFQSCFGKDSVIQAYWQNTRCFSSKLAEEFHIGFAPVENRVLWDFLSKAGFQESLLQQSGLFLKNRSARFRGRLTIPIMDVQGRPIAFSCRVTDRVPQEDPSHLAKYINSPETPIFKKGASLFGLEKARKGAIEAKRLLLVEGQLDCARCHSVGLDFATAPQGTAVSDSQMRLIRRYTEHLEILFDADKAGQKAAFSLLPLAFTHALDIVFLSLKEGEDPDLVLKGEGKAAYDRLREAALSPMAFAVGFLLPNLSEVPVQARIHALKELFPALAACSSDWVRLAHIRELANLLFCSENMLSKEYVAWQAFSLSRPVAIDNSPAVAPPSKPVDLSGSLEASVLWLCLNHEAVLKETATILEEEWVDTRRLEGVLLARLLAAHQAGVGFKDLTEEILDHEQERVYLHRLLCQESEPEDVFENAKECVSGLSRKYDRSCVKHLNQSIEMCQDNKERENLLRERSVLRKRLLEVSHLKA